MFSLLSFRALYLCLSMLRPEFIPIPCSYSMENEYNLAPSINLEHVLPKKNFKNKLAVTQIYLEHIFVRTYTELCPDFTSKTSGKMPTSFFFFSSVFERDGLWIFLLPNSFLFGHKDFKYVSLHDDFLSSKNLGCQHSPDSEPCCGSMMRRFLT